MKKVLSLVLTLSLVLGTFSMAFAVAPDVVGEDCEQSVAVLTDLGVVTGYEDGTYRPENIVTRAEMAVLVVNALGLEDYVTDSATSSFTDMDGYGWAQGYIAYAQSLGVISGYGDGTFKPGKTVSYDEAATMLVAALGYTPEALQGTWPANYVVKAKALGILEDIQAGSAGANRGDVAIMIYQTLNQPIGTVDKDGNWGGTVTKRDAAGNVIAYDTMLTRLGAKGVDANVITGTEDSLINLTPYVGAFASVYTNSDDEIIAIDEVKSTFLTGSFDKAPADNTKFTTNGDDVEYSVDRYEYDLNDTTKDQTVKQFVNGKTGSFAANNTDTYVIGVNLSGKTIKEVYSITKWTESDAAQVEADDLSDIKDNQKLLGVDFPLDDNDEIDLNGFELIGVNSLDDIKADNVVYVYKADDEITRVAVGTEVVTGTVSRVSSDNEKVTINGTAYEFSVSNTNNAVGEAQLGEIKAGDEVELYLDAYGDIYAYETISGTADKYAVVLKAGYSGGFDSDAQIRLFTADGSSTVFNVKSKIANVTDANGNWISGNGVTGSGMLVSYAVNKDGEISALEKVAKDQTDDSKAISSKGYYDGKEILSDAVIFTTTNPGSDDADDYAVSTLSKVVDSDGTAAWYDTNSSNRITAMLLKNFSSTGDVYGALTGWSSVGDEEWEFDMYVDGKEATYNSGLSGENYDDSVVLYKLKFDSAGDVSEMSAVATTRSAMTDFANPDNEDIGVGFVLITDGGISVSGNTVTVTTKGATYIEGNTSITDELKITLDSGVAIYMEDDGDWSLPGKSALRSLEKDDKVYLYNVNSDDTEIMTVVLIEKANA